MTSLVGRMSQPIPSVTFPPPTAAPGHLTKNIMPREWALPITIVSGGGGGGEFDRGWTVAKIRLTGIVPTQNCFFGIHTEYETEFSFSFNPSLTKPFSTHIFYQGRGGGGGLARPSCYLKNCCLLVKEGLRTVKYAVMFCHILYGIQ